MRRENEIRYIASSSRMASPFSKIGIVLLEIMRVILGGIFTFSGFVKAIDPLGSTYKFEDYLHAFGGFWGQLSIVAFPAAIALSSFELALGLCFLLKVKLKTTSLFALLFMGVMLPLTLYIALVNPVTDCGCFGDALIISNWQTFYKNIVISLILVLMFIFGDRLYPIFNKHVEYIIVLLFVLTGIALSIYSHRHLPMIDFRPYKIGTYLPSAMKIPEGMPTDKYDTKLIYQKNGISQEFTLENYPKNDTTWVFVEQKSTLVQKGYEPPVRNFTIVDANHNDITDNILHQPKVHLLVMYDVNKTSSEGVRKAEILYRKAMATNEPFYALTASTDDDIAKLRHLTGITFPFCTADPTTLKTIIRANPGLVTLEQGTVAGKWNWRDWD